MPVRLLWDGRDQISEGIGMMKVGLIPTGLPVPNDQSYRAIVAECG
jgi:hypothetical protein